MKATGQQLLHQDGTEVFTGRADQVAAREVVARKATTVTRNPAEVTAAGCDDCTWQPAPGNVHQTRLACQQHARKAQHATFVIATACTNYDNRRKEQ
jgi:hypothetical protein